MPCGARRLQRHCAGLCAGLLALATLLRLPGAFVARAGRASAAAARGRGFSCGHLRQGRIDRRGKTARLSTPLYKVIGGAEFLRRVSKRDATYQFGEDAPGGPYELGLPEESDLPEVVDLVMNSFARNFEAKNKELADKFGPLSALIQGWTNAQDRDKMREGIKFRLAEGIQFPTFARPIRQDRTFAIILRTRERRGEVGELVGYFELCLLPTDGRQAEDALPPARGDPEPMPYFSNLCVAADYRGGGLGKSLLRFAEDIVAYAWKDEDLYTHIDDYEPSKKMYPAEGYEPVSPPGKDGVTHLHKTIEIEEEPPDEEEEEEEPLEEIEETALVKAERDIMIAEAEQEERQRELDAEKYGRPYL